MSSHLKLPRVTRVAALAIAAILAAAIAFTTVQLARPDAHAKVKSGIKSGKGVIQGPPGPTLDQPLDVPPAKQMTMAAALSALGVPVYLPNTTAVQPAGAGAVWEGEAGESKTMAVTFPSQGLIVYYMRPVPYADPAAGYKDVADGLPSSKVVELNGTTPALVIAENSDDTGANFGVVAFEMKDVEVRVMGHKDEATLEAIAQSILARSSSTSSSTP